MDDLKNTDIDYLDDDVIIDYDSVDEEDNDDTETEFDLDDDDALDDFYDESDNVDDSIEIDYTDDDEIIDFGDDTEQDNSDDFNIDELVEDADEIEESDTSNVLNDEIEVDNTDTFSDGITEQIDYTEDDEVIDLSEDTDDESETDTDEIENINDTDESEESDEQSDEPDDIEEGQDIADDYGVTVSLEESGLNDNDSFDVVLSGGNSFMDTNGDIVVQDKDDNGERFELKYIDITNIAVTNRIRSNKNVDSLVQSIKSTGLLQPLTVAPLATDGLYVLIAGFRRILACAKSGIKSIPCIVNKKINVPDVPILEALYNHNCNYTMKEIVDYINYLEKEKGISSASMIEYLLQMDSGDYTKLKDILTDNDDDIVSALMNGQITIAQAFKKLEQRRKKESKEEKELKKAEQVYGDAEESGADKLAGSGEEADEDVALTDDEIAELSISADDLNSVDDKSLDEMVEEGKNMEGFEPHKQDYRDREIIDPAIRKAVMSKYKNTCQCCGRGGPDYVDILDLHHIVEVYLGGVDSVENSIVLCLNCHRQVHLYAFNQLHIPASKTQDELEAEVIAKIAEKNAENKSKGKPELTQEEEDDIREIHFAVYKQEQNKYKRIVMLGNVIRKGLQQKNIKLEQAKKEHPIDKIGRNKPGQKNTIA